MILAARKDSSSAVDGQDELAAKMATNLKGAMGQRIQKALQKVEDKKRKRAARKAQWDELYNKKPGMCQTASLTLAYEARYITACISHTYEYLG